MYNAGTPKQPFRNRPGGACVWALMGEAGWSVGLWSAAASIFERGISSFDGRRDEVGKERSGNVSWQLIRRHGGRFPKPAAANMLISKEIFPAAVRVQAGTRLTYSVAVDICTDARADTSATRRASARWRVAITTPICPVTRCASSVCWAKPASWVAQAFLPVSSDLLPRRLQDCRETAGWRQL